MYSIWGWLRSYKLHIPRIACHDHHVQPSSGVRHVIPHLHTVWQHGPEDYNFREKWYANACECLSSSGPTHAPCR